MPLVLAVVLVAVLEELGAAACFLLVLRPKRHQTNRTAWTKKATRGDGRHEQGDSKGGTPPVSSL